MKPDWKDAPEWAQWLGVDGDGIAVFYESEPLWDNSGYWFQQMGSRIHECDDRHSDGPFKEPRP